MSFASVLKPQDTSGLFDYVEFFRVTPSQVDTPRQIRARPARTLKLWHPQLRGAGFAVHGASEMEPRGSVRELRGPKGNLHLSIHLLYISICRDEDGFVLNIGF